MQHNILLIMSLSGSLVFILYLFLYPLSKRFFPEKWRYNILKIGLLFYLFPFPYFRNSIRGILDILWFQPKPTKITYNFSNTIIKVGESLYIPKYFKVMWGTMFFICIISTIIICCQMYKYFYLKKVFNQNKKNMNIKKFSDCLTRVQKDIQLQINMEIFFIDLDISPCVIGIFKPRLYLPSYMIENMSNTQIELIIKHELIHIKSRDLLFRLLALIAIAVHWFNPICYLLFFEISQLSEIYCDCQVIMGHPDEYRKEYSNLLIEMARRTPTKSNLVSMGLINNNKHLIKRRVTEMKNNRKKQKVLSTIIGVIIFLLGSVTATAAYEPPVKVKTNEKLNKDILGKSWGAFTTEDVTDDIQPLPYDKFFTDENGNIFEVNDNTSPRAFCSHSYVNGNYQLHTKNDNGGCRISIYSAKRCPRCGELIYNNLISESKHTVCYH